MEDQSSTTDIDKQETDIYQNAIDKKMKISTEKELSTSYNIIEQEENKELKVLSDASLSSYNFSLYSNIYSYSKSIAPALVPVAYTAQQLRTAYLCSDVVNNINVRKVKVAIIIWYSNPDLQANLQTFWTSQNGMGRTGNAPTITIHPMPNCPSDTATMVETNLDIQMVCCMNPNADIHVVQAASNSTAFILQAIQYASNTIQADVISMSFGNTENQGRTNLMDTYFLNPNICYCAASGDNNYVSYPSSNPNVISVGGTSLIDIGNSQTKRQETAWEFAGSGYSTIYNKPAYQNEVSQTYRVTPDVAMVANGNTGVYVYVNNNWNIVGGTSASTPLFAGILSLAIQTRLNNNTVIPLTSVVNTTSINVQTILYNWYKQGVLYDSNTFNDVTSGIDGIYPAGSGYDIATGLGSPNNNNFVTNLANLQIISNICFVAGVLVTTDQGKIHIEKLNPDIHTINKEKIVAVTQTITQDEFLVCFEQDSVGMSIPCQKTICSKRHKIFYQDQMIGAGEFIDKFEGVTKINYTGCVLYNVLMEKYSTMIVNNMTCETLDPHCDIAQLYKKYV